MVTFSQLRRKPRKVVRQFRRSVGLQKSPQKRGVCLRVYTMSPKKPNSAVRKVVKVKLYCSGRCVLAAVPGFGHNLNEHSVVLVRGGRVPDLPGVQYRIIRGKYDFVSKESQVRSARRSKFSVEKKKKIKMLKIEEFYEIFLKKLIKTFMTGGNKLVLEKKVDKVTYELKKKFGVNFKIFFVQNILKLMPRVRLRSKMKAGIIYKVPFFLTFREKVSFAFLWFKEAVLKRYDLGLEKKIVTELLEISKKRGAALKKREEVHKIAALNRGFLKSLK